MNRPGMSMDTLKSPAGGAGVQATEEMRSPFADIHFDFNKSLIKDDDKPGLQKIATCLKQHPRVKVRSEDRIKINERDKSPLEPS